ncbi:hypothetical protein GUJ93_ZPchr0001g29320 [Zizania palustris]|uniref:BZIP domain-containing protein n=1 Tax=Zizania palustris TaxID=103762 RepID=A0A8J5RWD0_ZIZPA|nr:hypothetical protein GUJ93_ZPchr0001g29320 [Zizania palustris]
MASSRVMASSSSPSHTATDLARFAAGKTAAGSGGGGGGSGSGLGSMNVEELLRGIYADMPTPAPPDGVDRTMSPVPAPGIAAPRTAEEVWKEITGGGGGGVVTPVAPSVVAAGVGAGAGTGAEMTLEDFLARESAVKEDETLVTGPSAAAEGQMVMGFLNGAEGAGGVSSGRGRKRQMMDPMDRAAMQRQKRMIKNRESAARSRERKQAYIAELESLVAQLEEENAQMLKEQEEQHQKRLQELKEMVTPVIVRRMPSRDLRRTNSMEWVRGVEFFLARGLERGGGARSSERRRRAAEPAAEQATERAAAVRSKARGRAGRERATAARGRAGGSGARPRGRPSGRRRCAAKRADERAESGRRRCAAERAGERATEQSESGRRRCAAEHAAERATEPVVVCSRFLSSLASPNSPLSLSADR